MSVTLPQAGSLNPSHLGPNNFTIGHDDRMTQSSLHSVFKKDYPVHNAYGRSEIAQPPRLGDVMHKDERYICDRASETVTAFQYTPMAKPVLMDVQNKLRVTNFKMDSDVSKVNSFATTHDHYYQPKYLPQAKKSGDAINIYSSHIPDGDPDKADARITNYRDKFPGHDPRKHPTIRAPTMHHGGPPTIKGDGYSVDYSTSHNDQFQGRWAPAPPAFPAPIGTNVPRGDRDKVGLGETTMKASYVDKSSTEFTPFDCGEVSRQLRQTNFNLRDGHGDWDDYRTVAAVSYQPKFDKIERHSPMRHRNQSDYPEGDRDPQRDSERMNTTNYRYYMGNPPRGLHNRIVSGANLRTKSNVWFGEPPLSKKFYDTTTGDTFDPKSVPYTYSKEMNAMQKSAIPLDYYKHDISHETTMANDYTNPKAPRLRPDEAALDSIKNSHIFPPLRNQTYFNTTHNDIFTPKSSEKYTYDSGRMQRSSVPLGTFNS